VAQGLLRTLPQILAERVRPLTSAPPVGAFVLVRAFSDVTGAELHPVEPALRGGLHGAWGAWGDRRVGPRVEAAYLVGVARARHVVGRQ
jgi:hypothetical protein